MPLRKSSLFLLGLAAGIAALCLMFAHARSSPGAAAPSITRSKELVGRLGLTDLCIFTDARYTRHPSMADYNTPFQDYPLSFEHFPSGSLLGPPPHLLTGGR